MDAETRLPWERQKGESEPAYKAFALYRDMPSGGRSIDEVADMLKPMPGGRAVSGRRTAWRRLHVWVQDWRWTERTAAYDAEEDRRHRELEEQSRAEERAIRLRIARRQQDVGEGLLAQGDRQLAEAEKERAEKGHPIPAFKRKVILRTETGMVVEEIPGAMDRMELGGRLSDRAEKTQRLERSLPTEYIEQTGTLRLEHEYKYVEHFGSELDALGRDLGALGLDPGTIEALQGAIVASDAGAEGSGEGGVESGEPG